MLINKSYISNNNSYSGQVPKYIVIHNTDNYSAGADALAHAKAQKAGNFKGYSAHVYVDDGAAYQATPFNRGAWHVGVNYGGRLFGTVNNRNSIGIEMCVNSGYNYERAFQNTVEVCKQIMKETGIPADRVVQHFDVCNKNCPSAIRAKGDWNRFKKLISSASSESESTGSYTKITGTAKATAEQMKKYIQSKNPQVAKSVLDMIPFYLSEGKTEGIRGDIAFAQSCLETGNFTFKGSAVTLEQNNFCGMGVTSNGMKGNSFSTPQLGIRAQIQHLKAYSNKEALKMECIDPRFKYVERGCAEYVEWLGIQENPKGNGWAAGANYGSKILQILNAITGTAGGSSTEPEKPASETYNLVATCETYNTAADASSRKNAVGSYGAGSYHVFKKANGMINVSKQKGVPGGWINPGDNKVSSGGDSTPFKVKVDISNLRIRKGPGTNNEWIGEYTGVGVFTIVATKSGTGSKKGWGLLKSYEKNQNGWISLDFATKI